MTKISIIIPVYNGEKYLNRCIASIVKQTHPDWELILIDDGSQDTSNAICDAWAEKDSRIKVIHQQNRGVSAARNAGLDMATGEFIGFVDADDEIAPETYEVALAQMDEHDIVMWDAMTVWSDGRTEPDTIPLLENNCTIARQDWTPELLRWMAGSACRCLYRTSCISEIRFPQGIKFSEDRLFNLYAMGRCNNLRYLKMPLYYRLMHAESTVHRYHEDYFEACLGAHIAIERALESHWQEDGYREVYNQQLIGGAMNAICNYFYKTSPLTISQKRKKVRALCQSKQLLQVLAEADACSLQGTLIKHKFVSMLCILAWLTNKKHRR